MMNNRQWFHANVPDLQSAEAILKAKGFDGSYLVRHSKSSKGDFSLAVRREDKVVHVKIKHEEDGYAVEGGETFATLTELVDTYANSVETLLEKNGRQIILKQPLNCVDPTSERWYHGHISREMTEKLLMDSGNRDAFLVRESNTHPGDYVIAVRCEDDELLHVIVDYKDDKYSIPGDGHYPFFDKIADLVDHYRMNNLACRGGKVLRLTKPVNTTRVNVGAISDRVNALQNDRDRLGKAGFYEEFEQLQKQEGLNLLEREEGRKPENIAKNRYKNILPFDATRVSLIDGDPNIPGTDYINANFIRMDLTAERSEYVATQGCLQNTIIDMWRMVWQEDVQIIVMLTKLMERSKNKCTRYWPDEYDDQKVLYMHRGQLVVKFITQVKAKDYEVNEFLLTKREHQDGEELEIVGERTVFHYHFLGWPDKSVPKDPGPLLDFVREVTEKRRELKQAAAAGPSGPMVVHCSAGIGRTGAFIVIDALLRLINRHGLECEIDIMRMVEQARSQRSGMVQTEEQYKFIYEVIRHYIETQKKRIVAQHLTTDEVPQDYGNLYITKNGLKQTTSVPLPGASTSPKGRTTSSIEPVYENASAKAKAIKDAKGGASPLYENARSRKR